MKDPDDTVIRVSSDIDVVNARIQARTMASQLGFTLTETCLISTAVSELARNLAEYARNGEIHLIILEGGLKTGIEVISTDTGPGIPDINKAMQDGYSTGNGLGLGLPGTRRIMDEFEILSEPGKGTTITTVKWLNPDKRRL